MATKKKNKITHEGVVPVYEDNGIPCYVLEDGTRVLSGRGFQEAVRIRDKPEEGGKRGGYILPTFLASKALNKFIENKLGVAKPEPIICYRGDQEIHGYEATMLVDVCDAILEARKSGIKLTERQEIVADQCEILVRSFAKVGIIALVDEATGYQYDREKDELQKILKAYIAEELRPWSQRFPLTFYKEIYRLNQWPFTPESIKKRPGVIGTWTNKYIYEQLPKGVLDELKGKTPKSASGNYTARFHQSLTDDIGDPHLQAQLNSVITLMEVSDSWKKFESAFNKLVERRSGHMQLELEFPDKKEKSKKAKKVSKGIQSGLFNEQLSGLLSVPPPHKEDKKK